MDNKELIAQLLDKQKGQGAEMRVLLGSAAGTIENLLGQVDALKAELRDERHRHDRYVDFELAEAEELRKLKEQLRWIPVTERLPDKMQQCVCRYVFGENEEYPFYQVLWYFVAEQNPHFQNEGSMGLRVTHWMPLPEPPKGE